MEGFTSLLLQAGKLRAEVAFPKLPHQVRFCTSFVPCSDLLTSLYWLLLSQKARVFKTTSVLPVTLVNNVTLVEDMFQLLLFNSQTSVT